ncbi:phage minor head protein [Ferrimonas sp.]|uniref:phage minor head protein n=1 Tax=Ferrimonas sp. TaxID=2080861 RepID=UPI003A8F5FA0
MTSPAQYGGLPFDKAVSFFRGKLDTPSERWADVWQQAHNRAFMVAGAMKTDLLSDLRQAVDDAIASGTSLHAFKRQFNDIAARHGWAFNGSPGWRAQVVYETNLRQAYNAGREQQIQLAKARRPYALYQHGDSLHPREWHLKWHNLVLPVDHPWWKTHSPQNGWGCKCKKYSLSERQLKARGLKVGPAPQGGSYEWVDRATGEVHQVPKGIDPGFDYQPTSLAQENVKLRQQLASKLPLEKRLLRRQIVESLFSTVKGVNANGLDALVTGLPQESQQRLQQFLSAAGTQTLILKQGEMSARSKASRGVAEEVARYLDKPLGGVGWQFTCRKPTKVNGFTSKSFNHVVVKAKAGDRLNKVEIDKVLTAAAEVIEQCVNNTGPNRYPSRNNSGDRYLHWSVSSHVRAQAGDAAGILATWLHELGHQVHYAIDSEAAPRSARFNTRYGWTNHQEQFAEAFAAYLLAPEGMRRHDSAMAAWMDKAIAKAISSALHSRQNKEK